MTLLGSEFVFPFTRCTRVDVAVGQYGTEPTDVEIDVFDHQGNQVASRHFLEVPAGSAFTTRGDAKVDNLARYVGANMSGLVVIRGSDTALLTASSLVIGKGMTSCVVLRPLDRSTGTLLVAPIAIGQQFHLLLCNPYRGEAQVVVELAARGEPFVELQPQVTLQHREVFMTDDAFTVGQPALVRITSPNRRPVQAWGLGIGRHRSELYPIPP